MLGKWCFEKVPGWWAQSSGYGLWILLLSVPKKQTMLHWSHLQRHSKNTLNGTPHRQHPQPYSTLVSGESQSKMREIEKGISRCERSYAAWGLRRELTVSDPRRDTKLPLEQGVLQISSHYSLCFVSDDNTLDASFVHKIQTLLVEFLKQRLPNVSKIYYFSDGCGGQYKNFKNFLNLCSPKEDFSIKAEWIFPATSHEKSSYDGLVVRWNAMLQNENEVCRYLSATEF